MTPAIVIVSAPTGYRGRLASYGSTETRATRVVTVAVPATSGQNIDAIEVVGEGATADPR